MPLPQAPAYEVGEGNAIRREGVVISPQDVALRLTAMETLLGEAYWLVMEGDLVEREGFMWDTRGRWLMRTLANVAGRRQA